MSIAVNKKGGAGISRFSLSSPWTILALAVATVAILLSLPIRLPVGPMYWDVIIYYDAANRIFSGQAPVIDFFTPVGPLGYYLFAGLLWVFPNAQPTLLAHWSLLLITAPLMAMLLWHVDRKSRGIALALLLPFLLFALLPFNTRAFYPFPGSDGFGIYNRQICQVLYILVAALLFVKDRLSLGLMIAIIMTALFLLKITGFVAGGIICAFAFLAGRVPLRVALASLALFAATLVLAELSSGLVSEYVANIISLVQMNSGTLLPRFLQATSLNFGIVLTTSALIAALAWSDWAGLKQRVANLFQSFGIASFNKLLDHRLFWLGAVLFAGILFETQNTGSQAMIFLWPVVLAVLMDSRFLLARPIQLVVVAGLAAAVAFPPAVVLIERAARAYIGSTKNLPLENANLKSLGAINMRSEVAMRAEHMLRFYPEHRALYDDMINVGELPTPMLYSDFDFQVVYLTAVDRAIDSIKALEAAKGIRFETIMSLNFVNPFPWLMDRSAPLHIAIGADPMRAVPDPGSDEEQATADADLVLYPTCPPTTANAMLHEMYAPALTKHIRMKLDACYDAYVHPRFAALFSQ